jgi:SH3-like domain-containing protein
LIHKSAECKYEPLEKSTTYYTLHEGAKVRILQTGNGWLKVRRADGRSGWLKKESVAGI